MRLNVQQVSIDPYERVIVISDIHGDIQLLQELLKKVSISTNDALFILGDLCEKGPNSLAVVRYVRHLQMEHPAVYVLKGNCDILIEHVWKNNEAVLDYMKNQPYSLFHDMLREHNHRLEDFTTIEELRSFYEAHFKKELDWLIDLPEAFETEEYIFIHAGIEDRTDWKRTSIAHALSAPSFYEKGHQADKTVVVGHWPVSNYRSSTTYHANPLIDQQKEIICIDGGNQVKHNGQLNALIIEGGSLSSQYVDHFTDVQTVRKSYAALEDCLGAVGYPDYALDIVEEGDAFTLCKNGAKYKWVKNEYIVQDDQQTHCKGDVSATFLSVIEGDSVAIIDSSCTSYTLVKKDGIIGWIPDASLSGKK